MAKRLLFMLVVTLGILVVSIGVQAKTELTVWTIWEPDFEKVVVEPFNQQSENVIVKHEYVPDHDSMLQKLTATLVAGTPPDIAITDACFTRRFAEKSDGFMGEDILSMSDKINVDEIPEVLKEFSEVNDKFYAIPFTSNDIILYYNKRLFKEAGLQNPPKDWNELVEYGKKLTDPSKQQWGLGIPFFYEYYEIPSWDFQVFVYQNEGKFLNDDMTKSHLDEPEAIEALQFWQDLVHKHEITPRKAPENAFIRGKVAMWVEGSWMLSPESWGFRALMKDDFGTAILPYKKVPATNVGGEHFITLTSEEAKKEAILEFYEFALSPEINAEFAISGGYMPVTSSAFESKTWGNFVNQEPGVQAAMDALDYGYSRPTISEYSEISRTITEAIHKVLYKQATPKEALKFADEKIENLLQK